MTRRLVTLWKQNHGNQKIKDRFLFNQEENSIDNCLYARLASTRCMLRTTGRDWQDWIRLQAAKPYQLRTAICSRPLQTISICRY